jgi:hypothetical protein
MHWSIWLILAGLGIELVGGLVLSAQAIGLKRINAFVEFLTDFAFGWMGSEDVPEMRKGIAQAISMLLLTGLWFFVLIYAFNHPEIFDDRSNWRIWVYGALIISGPPIAIAFLLAFLSKLLSFAEAQEAKGTAGIVGFLLLLAGIALQFLGTIFDALHRG